MLTADARLREVDGVGKLALVELQNRHAAPSNLVGTTNFYTAPRHK